VIRDQGLARTSLPVQNDRFWRRSGYGRVDFVGEFPDVFVATDDAVLVENVVDVQQLAISEDIVAAVGIDGLEEVVTSTHSVFATVLHTTSIVGLSEKFSTRFRVSSGISSGLFPVFIPTNSVSGVCVPSFDRHSNSI